ncbi:glycosyltransferase [Vibrio sp. 1863]|uniref:glycosyltransferase family 4 protein n=1 Tax=Vibrio sp. 1863 TaxID=3074579 RepID=UPI00296495FF|nr:glycosyltransferase [Vibrio sp. 1863]MDW2075395.1 glycosyltransferase [Vibrio sp. 1863]
MKFLTIFPDFEDFHKKKDVGQVGVRMAKALDCEPYMLSYNKQLGHQIFCEPGILHLLRINEWKSRISHRKLDLNVLLFLIKNARAFKYLNLYHETFATQVYTIIYKSINPKGKVYIKLDLDVQHEKTKTHSEDNKLKRIIKKVVYDLYQKKLSIASVESIEGYDILRSKGHYDKNKLILLANGFSSDYYNEFNLEPTFEDKEDLILTVGRIGSEQKNIQLMLNVLSKVNLRNWKYVFAGPISRPFDNAIKQFFIENPDKVGAVEFVGMKNDKELNDLYRRAKLFVLSSNFEGFPLVFPEALFFGCHILTTNVSSSMDVTKQGTIGTVVPIGNADAMQRGLQFLIDNDVNEDMFLKSRELGINEFSWDSIISNSFDKLKNNNE